jgi:hypothetical protein
LTGGAPDGATCVNTEKLEAGKAKRTENAARQKEVQKVREEKALAEKNRLAARTEQEVESEREELKAKAAEKKRERDEKLAEEMAKLVPGRAGGGRVREQSSASLRAAFQWSERNA